MVKITPRISAANTVNLTVQIDIDDFSGTAADTRITRNVLTNANVSSGAILALGGLIKNTTAHSLSETPLLSKVPILGWFFKKRSGRAQKTNLTIFISPTIIQPRLRQGVGAYTQDYIAIANNYAQEGALFDSLREPITRWFFKTGTEAPEILEGFLAKDELKSSGNPHAQKNSHYTKALDTAQQIAHKTTPAPHKQNSEAQKEKAQGLTPQPANTQAQDLKALIDNDNPLLKAMG